jgi:DNA-binding transcriptional LysR family regulator
MKFRQLEAFRYIMITGSMVGAAAQMHVTQSAISRLIRDLEYSLNFKLFERKQGSLELTRAGLQFYESVEENFLGLDRLENIARDIRENSTDAFRIAAGHSMATTLLPQVVGRFSCKYPDTRISIHSHRLAQTVMRLQNASVDIAIASGLPNLQNTKRLLLGTAPQACILHQDHPLAKKSVIQPEDLSGQSVIGIMPDGPMHWDELDRTLTDRGVNIKRNYEINNSHTAYSLVAQGLAIGVVEPLAVHLWKHHGVVQRPFEPAIDINYYCAIQSRQGPRPELDHFINLITEEIKKLHCF